MSEEAFQRWVRSLPWFEEFLRRYGEEPDLDTRDYDYRSAFRAGLAPSRHRDGAYHWPSVTPNGLMLKGEGHPTRWKEEFVSRTGMDPDDFLEYPGEFAEGGLSRRGVLGALAAAAAGAAAKKGKGLIDNAAPAAGRAAAKAAMRDADKLLPKDWDTFDIIRDWAEQNMYGSKLDIGDYGLEPAEARNIKRYMDKIAKEIPDPHAQHWTIQAKNGWELGDGDYDVLRGFVEDVRAAGKNPFETITLEDFLQKSTGLYDDALQLKSTADLLKNIRVTPDQLEEGSGAVPASTYDILQKSLRDHIESIMEDLAHDAARTAQKAPPEIPPKPPRGISRANFSNPSTFQFMNDLANRYSPKGSGPTPQELEWLNQTRNSGQAPIFERMLQDLYGKEHDFKEINQGLWDISVHDPDRTYGSSGSPALATVASHRFRNWEK